MILCKGAKLYGFAGKRAYHDRHFRRTVLSAVRQLTMLLQTFYLLYITVSLGVPFLSLINNEDKLVTIPKAPAMKKRYFILK
jgi:cell division protein FtsX